MGRKGRGKETHGTSLGGQGAPPQPRREAEGGGGEGGPTTVALGAAGPGGHARGHGLRACVGRS